MRRSIMGRRTGRYVCLDKELRLANLAQKEVLRITGGKGVDIVYDPVGEC